MSRLRRYVCSPRPVLGSDVPSAMKLMPDACLRYAGQVGDRDADHTVDRPNVVELEASTTRWYPSVFSAVASTIGAVLSCVVVMSVSFHGAVLAVQLHFRHVAYHTVVSKTCSRPVDR